MFGASTVRFSKIQGVEPKADDGVNPFGYLLVGQKGDKFRRWGKSAYQFFYLLVESCRTSPIFRSTPSQQEIFIQ